jgi:chromosome segregation ATPase
MLPLSEMDAAIAYHRARDRGLMPSQTSIHEEITLRLQELEATRDELAPALQDRTHQVVGTISGLAQEAMASDPTCAARDQVDNLNQTVSDLKQTREGTTEVLGKAKKHLSDVTEGYHKLERQLQTLRRLQEEKFRHDPTFNFIEEGGRRACAAISKPRNIQR